MDTFKRASVSHVEYEGKSWIHAFQMIIQLIRTMSLVSSCFEVKPGATQKEGASAIFFPHSKTLFS